MDFQLECFAVEKAGELRVYHVKHSNGSIDLIQSMAALQGASSRVNISDHCKMLKIDNSFFKLDNGAYIQIGSLGLSWWAVDESLTMMLLTNSSIAELDSSKNSFKSIYNVSGNLSSTTRLLSRQQTDGSKSITVAKMSVDAAWVQFLHWNGQEMRVMLTYNKNSFTSSPSLTLSNRGSKALITGTRSG
jgi:hypothetical protein